MHPMFYVVPADDGAYWCVMRVGDPNALVGTRRYARAVEIASVLER